MINSYKTHIYTLTEPLSLYLKEEVINIDDIASNEFICETLYSAISSGTETGAYNGLSPLRPGKFYPRVVGYCNVSKVIFTGANVSKIAINDVILTFQSHRTHFKCSENDFFLKIEESTAKTTVAAYLYHLGYHSLITAGAKQGHNVGIIGAGVLGYTSSIMSTIAGCNTFVFTNQEAATKKLSKKGIHAFSKDESVSEKVDKLTHGVGLDIIINTSNSWADWLFALKMTNKGGTIVNLGFPGRGEPNPQFNPLDPQYVYLKNLTIKALCPITESDIPPYDIRFNIKRNLLYILDLINSGIIKPEEIITEQINFKMLDYQYNKYNIKSKYMLSTLLKWTD
jgi:threonine dehydrogenase-like Zn-dependent dehydrogenase